VGDTKVLKKKDLRLNGKFERSLAWRSGIETFLHLAQTS
jgi:hypothetical protein